MGLPSFIFNELPLFLGANSYFSGRVHVAATTPETLDTSKFTGVDVGLRKAGCRSRCGYSVPKTLAERMHVCPPMWTETQWGRNAAKAVELKELSAEVR
ncbi:MAG TPA: hypothetical protein DCP92_00400 [Nitrospiraceae bacterium]|jgi:hypothetical protein|nr:hypothetical protein [Nitrospiraceae bacterium]